MIRSPIRLLVMRKDEPELTVYYDGSCPLCLREIGFYRRREGAQTLAWIDVSDEAGQARLPDGVPREQALGRLHLIGKDGRIHSGGEAFAMIWSELPALRWLGRLMALPPFAWALEGIYRLHLALRGFIRRRR